MSKLLIHIWFLPIKSTFSEKNKSIGVVVIDGYYNNHKWIENGATSAKTSKCVNPVSEGLITQMFSGGFRGNSASRSSLEVADL